MNDETNNRWIWAKGICYDRKKHSKKLIDYMRRLIKDYYCSVYPYCHSGCPLCKDDENEVWSCIIDQKKTTLKELNCVYCWVKAEMNKQRRHNNE